MSETPVLAANPTSSGRRMRIQTQKYSSQTASAGLVFFRHSVQLLIKSPYRDRAALRHTVVDRLHDSQDPKRSIGVLLEECVVNHRSEGMEIAIDLMANFGSQVIEYARDFWRKDIGRWEKEPTQPRHHVNDDIWYVLLRAAGASKLGAFQKIGMLSYCAADGPPPVREASLRALGDMGGPVATRLVRRLGDTDSSVMVRETAAEVLSDLEG